MNQLLSGHGHNKITETPTLNRRFPPLPDIRKVQQIVELFIHKQLK
jgi:hypothetical protein